MSLSRQQTDMECALCNTPHPLQACTVNLPNMESVLCKTTNSKHKSHLSKDNSNHNSAYTEFINDRVSWLWFRILNLEMHLKETLSRCKGQTHETYKTEKQKQSGNRNWRHGIPGKKSRGGSDASLIAWAFSEASIGIIRNLDS